MTKVIEVAVIVDWLKTKLTNRSCGIIFESHSHNSFDDIQNFIESYDHPFKTSIIYYQAFPGETTLEFIDTLGEELESKLGTPIPYKKSTLLNIIKNAELKMIIIDDCHFCSQATLEKLLNLFYGCKVSIILVGDYQKLTSSQILDYPLVAQWDCVRAKLH